MWRRVALTACLALAACGKQTTQGDAQTPPADPVAAGVATVPAAAPKKLDVNCNKVKGELAPKGQPADDILGVRHGMKLEHVRAVLACANPNYIMEESENTSGPADLPSSRRVVLRADAGLDKFRGDFIGPKGEERLVRAARAVEYPTGKEPLVTVITNTLQEKYGAFDSRDSGADRVAGAQLYSPDGQRMGIDNTDYGACVSNVGQGLDGGYGLASCGPVVAFTVQRKPGNPELTRTFTVVTMNQSATLRESKAADAAATAKATAAASAAADRGETPRL